MTRYSELTPGDGWTVERYGQRKDGNTYVSVERVVAFARAEDEDEGGEFSYLVPLVADGLGVVAAGPEGRLRHVGEDEDEERGERLARDYNQRTAQIERFTRTEADGP